MFYFLGLPTVVVRGWMSNPGRRVWQQAKWTEQREREAVFFHTLRASLHGRAFSIIPDVSSRAQGSQGVCITAPWERVRFGDCI